jgi:hypothetical protein
MREVDDNPENVTICRQFCGTCPTFKLGELNRIPPNMLFCARGASEKPKEEIKDKGCFCPGCSIYKNYELSGGWFCTYGKEGRK